VTQLGLFKADDVDLSAVAKNLPLAQKVFDVAGWK
jgi:iron(III) transport system substrate-binding protein